MLQELHIKSFALIDELSIQFGGTFNVLTGETGAGKSIIIDALGAALGERTSPDVIRQGSDKCLVEAVFDVKPASYANQKAQDYGFDTEDGILVLSREITPTKSTCRVNGRTATSSVLRDISTYLIDIHGQHEHQSLLSSANHAALFDSFCGEEAVSLKQATRELYTELTELENERELLVTDERERARLVDLYSFQLEEISSANLIIGEDEELVNERNVLANSEKLRELASEICSAISENTNCAEDILGTAVADAEKMAEMDNSLKNALETVNNALINAQEAYSAFRDYRDRLESDPATLEQVENRLDTIRNLKKKYGDSIEDILEYRNSLSDKLAQLENLHDRSAELDSAVQKCRAQHFDVCKKLSSVRKKHLKDFEKRIMEELSDVAMDGCRFAISVSAVEPGPHGCDKLEFLISANPGEPLRPLAKVASGGEISRVMLALKNTTTADNIPTIIFDEIDSGIGGVTAQALANKLASIGQKYQTLCVTHLPQVASMAENHYRVCKNADDKRNTVYVEEVADEERIAELARMLGSSEDSSAANMHARELLLSRKSQ